jgi:hypothetical protein
MEKMIKRHSLFVCIILFIFQSFQIFAEAAADRGSVAWREVVLSRANDHRGADALETDGRIAIIGGVSQ